jgi:hypothetical protein
MKIKIKQTNKPLFYYFSFSKEVFINALLIILIGIFLLPQFAYSSEINTGTIINLTNQERKKLGLPPLAENSRLDQAALEKAKHILATGQFQHNFGDIKFSDWVKKQNYKYSYVGENLAIDFATSEGIMEAWKKSPLHYKNLVNGEFKDIGVAVVNGNFENEYTTLVVQIFGSLAETAFIAPSEKKVSEKFLAASLAKSSLRPEQNNPLSVKKGEGLGLEILSEKNFNKNNFVLDVDINQLTEQKNYKILNDGWLIDLNIFYANNLYFFLPVFVIILFLLIYYYLALRNLLYIQNYVK